MLQQRIARTLQAAWRQQPQWRQISRTPFTSSHLARVAVTPRLPSARFYSQEAEEKKKEEGTAEPAAEAAKPAEQEDPTKKELEAKKKENLDLTDRLKRQVAEYRNLQEQTKREVAAARDFALQRFAKDLLDSVDNLDRALINVPADKLTEANQDLLNLHSGLKMTETILLQTLKKHGLERFDPSVEGEKFDPSKHEAVFQAPMQGKEDGSVFHTQQKGFVYNGRVLRAAKVGVAKNS